MHRLYLCCSCEKHSHSQPSYWKVHIWPSTMQTRGVLAPLYSSRMLSVDRKLIDNYFDNWFIIWIIFQAKEATVPGFSFLSWHDSILKIFYSLHCWFYKTRQNQSSWPFKGMINKTSQEEKQQIINSGNLSCQRSQFTTEVRLWWGMAINVWKKSFYSRCYKMRAKIKELETGYWFSYFSKNWLSSILYESFSYSLTSLMTYALKTKKSN